ncbi:MAG: hypothetical protein HGA44_16685, partial [Cellulomonadaceae bacterium]|nr:hypothetical protein [Cellulomonadaceae bacterium]
MDVLDALSALGGVVSLVTAGLVLRRRSRSALAGPLAVVMLGTSWWTLMSLICRAVPDVGTKMLFVDLVLPGAGVLTAGAFWYATTMAGHGAILTRRTA